MKKMITRSLASVGITLGFLATLLMVAAPAFATLKLSTAVRSGMVEAIGTQLDADAGANSSATIYICSNASAIVACSSYVAGAACTGASVVLAVLPASAPAGTSSGTATYTFSAITQDSAADATGDASWFMILDQPDDGSAECIYTGSVGAGSGDLSLNTVSIVTGAIVSITSATITAPNP